MVTTCSPRPMRAVQRARLCAITCPASQAPLAAKRQGCGIGVPRASWTIPAWVDSHNDSWANHRGYQQGVGRRRPESLTFHSSVRQEATGTGIEGSDSPEYAQRLTVFLLRIVYSGPSARSLNYNLTSTKLGGTTW